MVEDSELLHRFARAGDPSAFAELVTRHINRVFAVALRQVGGDSHLAKDVSQTVFTTLARKAAALTAHPALSAWIHRTTHYSAIDTVRTEAHQGTREEKAQTMHDLHADARGCRGRVAVADRRGGVRASAWCADRAGCTRPTGRAS